MTYSRLQQIISNHMYHTMQHINVAKHHPYPQNLFPTREIGGFYYMIRNKSHKTDHK